jgi:hypothetical protein
MAYATIAGLPVQVGLYTVLVPMAIYALIGTSRPLSVSTTTTLAIPGGGPTRPGCPGWRPGVLDESFGKADSPGGSHQSGSSCERACGVISASRLEAERPIGYCVLTIKWMLVEH